MLSNYVSGDFGPPLGILRSNASPSLNPYRSDLLFTSMLAIGFIIAILGIPNKIKAFPPYSQGRA